MDPRECTTVLPFLLQFYAPLLPDFHLDDTTVFRVKVIDTWNGTVEDRGTVCGRFRVELPGRPYMAIQLKKEESPGSEHTTRGKRPS